MKLPSDHPIEKAEQDSLGRLKYAEDFVESVLNLDVNKGAVVGVYGPWGSGKTSFINLARDKFKEKDVEVLDFNPWMYSGTEQLVDRFFTEISIQFGNRKLKKLKRAFFRFGYAMHGSFSALLFSSEPIIMLLVREFIHLFKSIYSNANKRRQKFENVLRKYAKPIIVVIDDIDRLSDSEVQEMFKLIRLVANFPNLIYVVPIDHEQVIKMLHSEEISGRDYLDKIIQFSFPLPEINKGKIIEIIHSRITQAISDVKDPGPYDKHMWTYNLFSIIHSLFRNLRQVNRYGIAIQASVRNLDGRVALVDVLILESIRLFVPQVFGLLPKMIDILTAPPPIGNPDYSIYTYQPFEERKNIYRQKLLDLIKVGGDYEQVIHDAIQFLFPVGGRYLSNTMSSDAAIYEGERDRLYQERSVGHRDVFFFYLERCLNPNIKALVHVEQLIEYLKDDNMEELRLYIESINSEDFVSMIMNLNSYQSSFRSERVEPAIIILWNRLFEIMNFSLIYNSPSFIGTPNVVIFLNLITECFLSVIEKSNANISLRIIEKTRGLSFKIWLLGILTEKYKLLNDELISQIKNVICKEIKNADVSDLSKEWHFFVVLMWGKKHCLDKITCHIDDDPKFTLLVLLSARGEATEGMTLSWDHLVEYYGLPTLIQKINQLREKFDEIRPWIQEQKISLEVAEELKNLAISHLNEALNSGNDLSDDEDVKE